LVIPHRPQPRPVRVSRRPARPAGVRPGCPIVRAARWPWTMRPDVHKICGQVSAFHAAIW